jgi:hypothetical protein
MPRSRPQGQPTRGKTALNRLRQVDAYVALAYAHILSSGSPLVVDVGYGAYPWTALEMFERWLPLNPRLRLLGLEIDPERVAVAQPYAQPGRIDFQLGGFNVASNLGSDKAMLIRAYNVLRQYDESEVREALETMADALAPNGLLIEGTSNPSGRFITFDVYQKGSVGILLHKVLVFGWNFRGTCDVDDFKAILPKRLIHHAYDPTPAAFFSAWQRALQIARGAGHRDRHVLWQMAINHLRHLGYPVDRQKRLIKRGYLTLHNPLYGI